MTRFRNETLIPPQIPCVSKAIRYVENITLSGKNTRQECRNQVTDARTYGKSRCRYATRGRECRVSWEVERCRVHGWFRRASHWVLKVKHIGDQLFGLANSTQTQVNAPQSQRKVSLWCGYVIIDIWCSPNTANAESRSSFLLQDVFLAETYLQVCRLHWR